MSEISFYLDENVPTAVAEQLERRGIKVVSAQSLETLGDTDVNHLAAATEMGSVLCTHDQDFLRLASEGVEHAGIAFAEQFRATIGGWVRALVALHEQETAEDLVNQIRYLTVS